MAKGEMVVASYAGANPFTPSFGVTPPLLVGRDDVIESFAEGLDSSVGHPSRGLLITGARGSGKTVLLNRLEDEARARGWATVAVTTKPGMADELTNSRLPERARELFGGSQRSTITSVNLSILGLGAGATRTVAAEDHPAPDLRSRLFAFADEIEADRGAGVLVSIDEVHKAALADLREIGQVVQHAFRERKNVAFVAAGLPDSVSDLLNDDVLTFLRRAERYEMASVDPGDVERALEEPIRDRKRSIDRGALDRAVVGTGGYPFLIQSVGFETWKASRGAETISIDHAEQGVTTARRRIGRLVHEPSLSQLSDTDRTFLVAMAIDDGPSRTGDIVVRMNVIRQYVNTYRVRLLEAGLIVSAGHGRIDFALPYLREYLRSHAAASLVLEGDGDGGE